MTIPPIETAALPPGVVVMGNVAIFDGVVCRMDTAETQAVWRRILSSVAPRVPGSEVVLLPPETTE